MTRSSIQLFRLELKQSYYKNKAVKIRMTEVNLQDISSFYFSATPAEIHSRMKAGES